VKHHNKIESFFLLFYAFDIYRSQMVMFNNLVAL